jgi:trk system potassium uptake protein TrkH
MARSFEGLESRPQVWGVLSGLIILGGIGFSVLYNLTEIVVARVTRPLRRPLFHPRQHRPRLSVTSRLVLISSGILLAVGTLGVLLLDRSEFMAGHSWGERLAHSWFQSVTARTAGFNTLPIGELGEGTQFLLVVLMFVGASPGSTGGGVKTVAIATTALAVITILRGRDRVEAWHRTIPDDVVRRALLIVALGALLVVVSTVVLMVIENPPRGELIAYLFEVTSAFATVGLSAGITPKLSVAGQCLIIAVMFIGRVGPLTLVMALAGRTTALRYRYPDERIVLG